jgi:hypothetical protein
VVRAEQIVLEVRRPDFSRVGQIDLGLVQDGKFIKRFNAVGAWQFTLPNEHPACRYLKVPSAGILVWFNDRPYLSGPMLSWTKVESSDDPIGTTTFVGADDLIVLADKAAYPLPSTADVTAQTVAYDTRTGPAESVMKAYVQANVGPGAPAARRDALNSGLRIEPDQQRGAKVTGTARFDQVGALLAELAGADATLGFDVVQDAERLGTLMTVYEITDRSAFVRMDVDNDLLKSTLSGIGAPKLTRALVAGQGEGEERTFVEVTDDLAVQAEQQWGRRIEQFIDQRQTDDPDQLTQAGIKEIQENARTIASLKVVPQDGDTMRYGIDWNTGDRVGVVVDEQVLVDTVSEAILVIDEGDTEVGATIGDPVGYDWEAAVTRSLNDHSARISRIERAQ